MLAIHGKLPNVGRASGSLRTEDVEGSVNTDIETALSNGISIINAHDGTESKTSAGATGSQPIYQSVNDQSSAVMGYCSD